LQSGTSLARRSLSSPVLFNYKRKGVNHKDNSEYN